MPDTHALLSPSSSERWISCPPSVRMSEGIEEKPSEYAAEGTAAHSLCEYKLRELLGYKQSDIRENLDYYNEEMEDCTEEYRNYINELLAENNGRKPLMFVEQRVDFSRFVKEGFGTSDCIIIDNDTIYVIDFKYGKGVEVNAVNNTQVMIYAIGALEMFDGIFDINHVIMTIFQPRLSNISTFEMTKDELYHWAFNVLKPAADMAYQGTGTFKCGNHCRFCKAKTICRARAEYNLKLAQYDFKMPATLEDIEIESLLGKLDMLIDWAEDIKTYALDQAVQGKKWRGYKIVEGRSNRKYTDEKAVADKVTKAGYDPYEKKVLGITAMSKLLGKKKFEELLSGLVEKPQGKPTLVSESDDRPEMNIAANAAQDFEEDN
ncbi:DUF2800 domain-containing protein [Candidatus Pseudoruminococcus sp.]|uniref:DUF2800 domain-containing protein n=1 Tax=Candidatus Pseudoruminococcus sp. TaxID=3101048 RepID=UPI00399A9D3E